MNDAPHDAPGARQLLAAVEEFLRIEVLPGAEGRAGFHLRVAVNALAIVGRQLELGPEQAAAHARRMADLGVADEAELAAAIRAGDFDDRLAEVTAAVRATVADKLAVANPEYLTSSPDDT